VVPGREGCVDLRAAIPSGVDESKRLVNNKVHIELVNNEAKGCWYAAPSTVFEGYTLADASSRLGLLDGFGFGLPPPPASHTDALKSLSIPDAFDSRQQWGGVCNSITTIRNQGDCGGCWAFSAAETLADRFCIAASRATQPNFTNLSLSPQWVLDCDKTDMGCGGGLLDDAWGFLKSTGVVAETCDPYLYCAHPVSGSCEVGPHPPRPVPSQHACPSTCQNINGSSTGALTHRFKAASAYAVAKPGDVESIQKEILAHGPVQVGFQVFSDFMTYHNGTYFRTASAQGPRGGHAVKIVGWGVDEQKVPYWIVANRCAAAELLIACNSNQSSEILIDSSPPLFM
jgi:cathepsin B